MSDHHTGFLSGIGRQLLVLAGGVVSVHTFIPAFINHLESIFSFSTLQALGVYTFLYFLLPALILFYLLITIRPRAGDEEQPMAGGRAWWKQPEGRIAVALLCFTYVLLNLHYPPLNTIGSLLLIGATIFIIVFNYRKLNKRLSHHREFFLLSALALLIFGIFIINNMSRLMTNFNQFDQSKKDLAVHHYQHFKNEINDSAADIIKELPAELSRITYRSLFQYPVGKVAGYTFPDSLRAIYTEDYQTAVRSIDKLRLEKESNDTRAIDSLKWASANIIKKAHQRDSTAFAHYQLAVFLQDYFHSKKESFGNDFRSHWKDLVNIIHDKGLLWFLLLGIIGLHCWLRESEKYQKALKEHQIYTRWESAEDRVKQLEEEMAYRERTASQLMTFVSVIIVLIIPIFRVVEEKDISINKPFLTVQVESLLNQRNLSLQTQGTPTADNGPAENQDLGMILALLEQLRLKTEGIRNTTGEIKYNTQKIDATTNSIEQLTRQVGTRSVSDPEDVDFFTKKNTPEQ